VSGHGIGHQPQPNPLHVVVSRDSLLLHPPCCTSPVVLSRDGLNLDHAHRIQCSKCRLWWRADLRATVNRLSVSWLRGQAP